MTYETELAGGAGLKFSIDDHYNDGFFWDPDHLLKQGSFHDLRAAVTWTAVSGKWDVVLWGNNLTDEVVATSAASGGSTTTGLKEPREYGVTLRVRH
jgi:hypothetical protein